MKAMYEKHAKKMVFVYLISMCVLFFWAAVIDQNALEVKLVLLSFGSCVGVMVVSVLSVKLFYLLWNYVSLLFSRRKEKYNREIPSIHPAIASIINNVGGFSVKRIVSSSLLRLISRGVISIVKRQDEDGKTILSLKYNRKANVELTEIDEAVLELTGGKHKKNIFSHDDFSIKHVSEKRARHLFRVIRRDGEKYINQNANGLADLLGVISMFLLIVASLGPYFSLVLHPEWYGVSDGWSDTSFAYMQASWVFSMISVFIFPSFSLVFLSYFLETQYPLSRTGIEVWNDLRALKRWLEDYTLVEEKDSLSVKMWEEYMVYAVALGVSPRVYKDFAPLVETVDDVFVLAIDEML